MAFAFSESDRKMRHFENFKHKKVGHLKKKHVMNFKTEKNPKMKFFDLRTFRNKMQMQSHDKIIFYMLFGAVFLFQ